MGRNSTYSDELAQEIASRLVGGESVRSICSNEGMPSEYTFYNWLANRPDFLRIIAPAREAQQEFVGDNIVDIADDATPETVQVAKLRIWARQWRAGKLAPKKYGEKAKDESEKPAPITINVALLSADERASFRAMAMKVLSAPKTIEHEPTR